MPEEVDWRDAGCELFPSCLNCPLSRCIEEESRGRQRLRQQAMRQQVVELRWMGRSTEEIGAILGISIRTVQRTLKGGVRND